MKKETYLCECNILNQEINNNIKEKLPKEETYNELSCFFNIFSDTTKLKILSVLDYHEMCVCDIANTLGKSKSLISHGLATLRENGLVKYRREGKVVYYSLDDEHVSKVYEIALSHINHKKEGK